MTRAKDEKNKLYLEEQEKFMHSKINEIREAHSEHKAREAWQVINQISKIKPPGKVSSEQTVTKTEWKSGKLDLATSYDNQPR